MRGHAPGFLSVRIPKGPDCGAHEWCRQDAGTDACYRCRITRAHGRLSVSDRELADLEAAAVAGSQPAIEALERMITEGSVYVVPAELSRF